MPAKTWILANKIKSGATLIVALAAVIVLPVQLVAYAQDQSAQQVRESEIRQQAREEVIHGAIRAKHDLDDAKRSVSDTEEDLVYLEEQVVAGTPLTPTQDRKYGKLQRDLEKYEGDVKDAEDRLANPETHDATDTQ